MVGKDDDSILDGENGFPKWNSEFTMQSIDEIYEWVVANARKQIDWYSRKIPHKRTFSLLARILVLFFAAIGIICPLLDIFQPPIKNDLSTCLRIDVLKLGYLAFAQAGIIVMFDKYFGLSSGWMRFIETKLKLEEHLKMFYLDWAGLKARNISDAELITHMKTFLQQVEGLVSHESALWIREFKSNLASIDDLVKKNKGH
jgi:hypothetical protein